MIDVFVVVATRSARGSALVPYDSNVISKCGCIGETRILGGGVKSVDIERNTSREGGFLEQY